MQKGHRRQEWLRRLQGVSILSPQGVGRALAGAVAGIAKADAERPGEGGPGQLRAHAFQRVLAGGEPEGECRRKSSGLGGS